MKRFFLAGLLFATLLNAEDMEIDVGVSDAVSANHKLIKLLFSEDEKQKEEIRLLKKEVDELKLKVGNSRSVAITPTQVFNGVSYKKFVNTNFANIRKGPSGKEQIIKVGGFADIINCKSISAGWCITDEDLYVWNGSLSYVTPSELLITQDVFAKKGLIESSSPSQYLLRGTKVKAIGETKEKYILEGGLVINKKDAVK